MVIIDTDILIDAGRFIDDAIHCLVKIEAKFPLAVSIITEMELIVGCRNKNDLKLLNTFLSRF